MRPGKRTRRSFQMLLPLLLYTVCIVLYGLSFTRIWVHKQFLVSFTVQDADLFEYEVLYVPVIVFGSAVVISFLVLVWQSWTRKLMAFTHLLLGVFALAYCGNLWADVDQNFNLLYSETWFMSGADLGPGYFLFFASVVCLIFGGLCSLMVCMQE